MCESDRMPAIVTTDPVHLNEEGVVTHTDPMNSLRQRFTWQTWTSTSEATSGDSTHETYSSKQFVSPKPVTGGRGDDNRDESR